MMIKRNQTGSVQAALRKFPVVGLLGPRQVGKTTLAKHIGQLQKNRSVYLDLELPSDVTKLTDAELYLSRLSDRLVILDEIQRMPSLLPLLRALVDRDRRPGRFLILGSAAPDLIREASETLAGRIVYHELTPFCLSEIAFKDHRKLWIQGGFPDSFLASEQDSFAWREAFVKTYLERDIPQLGIQIPSLQLRRFWTMSAHYHGQIWNASRIAGSLGITSPTVARYLDILESTFILRSLKPYQKNTGKRLVKSPKVYFRDTGLLHALLRLKNFEDLAAHPIVGASWEGFVVEQIINLAGPRFESFYYRTQAGAEVDLVLVSNRQRIAVEVKFSLSPDLTRGFWNAMEDLKCKHAYLVYPGKETYPVSKNVSVVPVSELQKILA
jgi:hypothetical protein